MVSPDVQIAELKYQIRKKQSQMENLDKVLKRKRQNGLLTADSERSLLKEQEQLTYDIQDIESKIRRTENEETRKKNLGE